MMAAMVAVVGLNLASIPVSRDISLHQSSIDTIWSPPQLTISAGVDAYDIRYGMLRAMSSAWIGV